MNYTSTPRTQVDQQADDAFIQKLDDIFDNLEFVFHSDDSLFAPENLIGTPLSQNYCLPKIENSIHSHDRKSFIQVQPLSPVPYYGNFGQALE
jgi:hypothetical protein